MAQATSPNRSTTTQEEQYLVASGWIRSKCLLSMIPNVTTYTQIPCDYYHIFLIIFEFFNNTKTGTLTLLGFGTHHALNLSNLLDIK